jgi:hypothetical protein
MDLWDKVTAPVLSMNPWGLRNLDGKAKWVNSDGCSNLVDDVNVVVEATVTSDDPVFGGTKGAVQWWNSCYSAFIPDEDNNDAGNGTLLLASSDNRPLFIRWNANEEFFPEAGHSPSGPRTYMGLGQDNVEPFVYFGFSEFAKTVFFNELERMAALSSSTDINDMTMRNKANVFGVMGGVKLNANSNASIYSISGSVIAKNINAEFVSCPQGIYLVQVDNTVTKIFVPK